MNLVIYEHPLNEKLRMFMRVEHLFEKVNSCKSMAHSFQISTFFDSLVALIDLLDRMDIRSELIKELDRNEKDLVKWSEHPQIRNDILQETLQKVLRLQSDLTKMGKITSLIKEDPFLSTIISRFSIPGGSCNFDLPQLHYWQQLPSEERTKQIEHWLTELAIVDEAVALTLSFIRERSHFKSTRAVAGFYQDSTDKIELLRIRYTPEYGAYPTVSGNKYRYAIRFMQLCQTEGRKETEQDILFALACC